MTPLVLAMPGNEAAAGSLATALEAERGHLDATRFADGESHVRIRSDVSGRVVILQATLRDPDPQTVPLLLAAEAARELGALRVFLSAPYLAYMRQDTRFLEGDAVSARSYARLLSSVFDGLVTVDPHLHRIASLAEIYDVPARALQAAPLLADWIRRELQDPLVVGPDSDNRRDLGTSAKRWRRICPISSAGAMPSPAVIRPSCRTLMIVSSRLTEIPGARRSPLGVTKKP